MPYPSLTTTDSARHARRRTALARRLRRLREHCRELEQARRDVTEQVDVLCQDLVNAYQDLATQVHQVSHGSDYAALVRDELDLERVLRRTLEYLVQKAGPTNAAVFLPATMDEFSLGGYVNYDCSAQSADMLLEHLADVMAPRVADRAELLHITDNAAMDKWIGDDAAWLSDSHVLAFPACHDGEALAVVVLFRDGSEPFDAAMIQTCRALPAILGPALARLINVHHRAGVFDDLAGGETV